MKVRLFGSESCHKTQHYKAFFKALDIPFTFYDVIKDASHAEILRNLYSNRKLNFPTITIGNKKLRNPSDKDLEKWLDTLFKQNN